ncbi:MAG: vitamin B12-dependent ribonucleotide reductase [Clostridiales bacterium]|nr:vitamin B12-dependent ribonucleotide reductase [Clostridiales bacterium]
MQTIDSLIKRKFTKELEDSNKSVFDLFEYKTVDVFMKNWKTGEILVDMKELEFPENYSQNSCNIIASKYFRKAGLSGERDYEHSMKQIADRMVGFWADALFGEGLLTDKDQWQILYDELVYALLSQKWAPNSPQWFNTGIKRNYNITGGKSGLYYYDEAVGKVVESPDLYTRTQASACFIVPIEDKLLGKNSISDHYVSETTLFRGGSGVGTNFSVLRAKNEKLSGGGTSSGMMSFLKGFDRNAGAIKSGGTTRRAAKMVIVDIDHPEIEHFITWKAHEEQKVRDLGKMGYDTSMDGEAYQTVAGQNSNNSVRTNSEFMSKVLNLEAEPDSTIRLKGRLDHSVDSDVKTSDLWDKINRSSWECADPGLQFDDTFNSWHTCPSGADGKFGAKHNRINATNPCSEYAFLDNTACNLASINVFKFYDEKTHSFDIDSYTHLICLIQMILEASIYWGQFPTEAVAEGSYLFRTTGLGLANTASLFLLYGYPYDSDESRAMAASLAGIMTGYSYYTSALMAERLGAFESYDINSTYMKKIIRNHARVAGYLSDDFEDLNYDPLMVEHNLLPDGFSESLKSAWKLAIETGEKFGYRNAQVSVIAPTGTISFAMDCGATSVEPYYSHVVFKQLSGGGTMLIINPVIRATLKRLGYKKNEVENIFAFMLEKDESGTLKNHSLENAPALRPKHIKIFETANEISPQGHVLMVSAITPLISGAVSKTVNLPSKSSVEDVKNINKLAYTTGTKSIAIYRDGCKAAQPLSNGHITKADRAFDDYSYAELVDYAENCKNTPIRRKPRGMHLSRTHAAKIDDIELYITLGFYNDGNLAELFVSTDKEGTVVKGVLASLSKALSNMLQYNIPADEISRTLRNQKYEPSGFVSRHPYIKSATSISDLISKVIDIELGDFSRCHIKPKTFARVYSEEISLDEASNQHTRVKGEKIYGESCSKCGSNNLVRNGTCKVCQDCGTTTGCS